MSKVRARATLRYSVRRGPTHARGTQEATNKEQDHATTPGESPGTPRVVIDGEIVHVHRPGYPPEHLSIVGLVREHGALGLREQYALEIRTAGPRGSK